MVFAFSFPTSPYAYNHQLVAARLDTVFRRVREWPRDSEISGESDGQEQAAGSIHFYRQLLVCVLVDALPIRIYAIWRRRFPFLSFFSFFSVPVPAPACEHQLLPAKPHTVFRRIGRFHAAENFQRVGWPGASCAVDKLQWQQCYPDGIGMMPFSLSVDADGYL